MQSKSITQEYSKLTKHPEGSIREIFAISFPLMLSILSGNLMMFLDRLILANYSTDAMNAAVAAGSVCIIFLFGMIGISSIAEVFVGQYNGSKQFHKTGEPSWQMIWFSLFTFALFIPLGLFTGPYLVVSEQYDMHALPYFQWIMFFGPAFPMVAALTSFFVGLGRVMLVTITTFIGNGINVCLDFVLIFGVEGIVPPMGTKGAAIATGISQVIQVLLLLAFFFDSHHRKEHGTTNWKFKPQAFWQYLKIGLPNSIGHMIEIGAWAVLVNMMALVSSVHLTVFAVAQSIFILFAFAIEGLQKGVIAVTANFIGAKKWQMVKRTLRSAIILHLWIVVILVVPIIIYPDPIINEFLVDYPADQVQNVKSLIQFATIWVWVYCLFDGLTWIFAGILTASGDTKFVMLMSGCAAWFFGILPIYFFIVKMDGSPKLVWMLMGIYCSLNALCFYARYKSGRWKSMQIVANK